MVPNGQMIQNNHNQQYIMIQQAPPSNNTIVTTGSNFQQYIVQDQQPVQYMNNQGLIMQGENQNNSQYAEIRVKSLIFFNNFF